MHAIVWEQGALKSLYFRQEQDPWSRSGVIGGKETIYWFPCVVVTKNVVSDEGKTWKLRAANSRCL